MAEQQKSVQRKPARMPDGSPLDYEPVNEQGVVYLFSHLARRRFGLRIETVKAGFPDCIAHRDGKRVRIEFEYRSRNFLQHRHRASDCDWIVCWIHDWPGAPKRLRIVELRQEFGLGFNVWFQPAGEYASEIARIDQSDKWSVASQAMKGDLLLFYRTRPEAFVKDIFRVAGPVGHGRAGWKTGNDYMASIRRVTTLKAPLHLEQLKSHKVLQQAGFVRGNMRGRYRATDYWPELYHMIIGCNPELIRALKPFGPERLA